MSKKSKYIGFVGIIMAAFVGTLDSTIVNIALPSITDYFNVSLNDSSWISTIYALALAVFMITASKLADQFGRKKLMIIGLLIFGTSSALCSMSNSLLFLIVMRFIQGIGGAILTPIAIPMGIEIFGKEKMQVVVGASGAVVAFAAASGPPIGGILIKYINWQSVFFVNVPLVIIALVIILFFTEESYDNTVSKSIDWIGMIMLTISLFCLTFTLLKGRDYGWTSSLILSLFGIFVVSLIAFIIAELKVSAPMVELSLFKEITFTTSNICYLITGFGIMCPLLIFNYYLQNVLEYDTLKAAFIMMTVSLTAVVAVPAGSILSKKIGTRIVNFIGILVMGFGTLMLSRLSTDTTNETMVLYLIVCGFGLGFSVQSISSSVKFIPKEKSGMGSGIINAARQIGSCIGIAILVSMLNGNISNAKDDIKKDAVSYINNRHEIIYPVRKKLVQIVDDEFKNADGNTNNKITISQSSIQESVEKVMDNNKSLFSKNATFYNNADLKKVYDGAGSIRDGANKVYNGQNYLNSSLGKLDDGLGAAYNGSNSLNSNLGTFNDNMNKVAAGSQKLADGSQKIDTLINGINTLDGGSQKLMSQFSSSGDSNNPSIYDGVTSVDNGTQKISQSINSYEFAVNNTLYIMIKSNPEAAKLLDEYKNNINELKIKVSNTTDQNVKAQYIQQISALSNVISIYDAAISSNSENEFEYKLNGSQNVVSKGKELESGSTNLHNATSKVAAQFKDGGMFKSGVTQLTQGIHNISELAPQNLTQLKDGMGTLNTSLSKLNDASSKLYDGSSKLKDGINTAKDGNGKIKDGSSNLVDGSSKIKDGSETLVEKLGMAGQKAALQNVMSNIKSDKNDKVSKAFDKTFSFASIILMASSILGLFTDKKIDNEKDIKVGNNISKKEYN